MQRRERSAAPGEGSSLPRLQQPPQVTQSGPLGGAQEAPHKKNSLLLAELQ